MNGTGKADSNNEEGWTLLPDGTILTIDIQGAGAERYSPKTDTWSPAGTPLQPLTAASEIGPQVLRPNGSVFVGGASGHTGVYDTATGTWASGPDLPFSNGGQVIASDTPAALLPDGNVLVAAGNFFFEFDGIHLNPVPTPSRGCSVLLPLPSAQVFCASDVTQGHGATIDPAGISIYASTGSPDPAWAPAISSAPSSVQPGLTYSITGTQFNGLSQAVGFGDDYQGATNYPLIRITNAATGHVFYCRTHHHSTMAVATGAAPVSTQFDVPQNVETGPSTLVVVTNGIASKGWNVNVGSNPPTAPAIQSVEGSGLSLPAVKSVSANGFFTVFGANFAPGGTSRQISASDIVGNSLPKILASTCVLAGSLPAFLTYVSATQINGIAPVLPETGFAAVSVVANCGTTNPVTSPAVNVPVAGASPEFLYWLQNVSGGNPVIAIDALSGDYIGPPGLIPGITFRPARPGDTLTIYGIGFGQTGSGPAPGAIPSAADPVLSGASLTLGAITAQPDYVGVTPTIAGLYQVNVTIPVGIAPGNYPIVINVNGASTPGSAFLAVGP